MRCLSGHDGGCGSVRGGEEGRRKRSGDGGRTVEGIIFQVVGGERIPFGREWSVQLGQRQPLIQVSGDQTEPLRRLFGRHGSDYSGSHKGSLSNPHPPGGKSRGSPETNGELIGREL